MLAAGVVLVLASAPVGIYQPEGPTWMALQVLSAVLLVGGCIIAWRARG